MADSRAAVHCAHCAERFKVDNPTALIVWEGAGEVGEYHLVPAWNERSLTTVCGLPDDFDMSIGTVGVQLSEADLTHEWLRARDACRHCFAWVW